MRYSGEILETVGELAEALKDPRLKLVHLMMTSKDPVIPRQHLQDLSGLNPWTFEDCVRQLLKSGLVKRVKQGSESLYYLNF